MAALGEAVRERRLQLHGWTQADLVRESRLSVRTISDIESGKERPTGLHPITVSKLETALEWAPGTVERILAGKRPRPLTAVNNGRVEVDGDVTISLPVPPGTDRSLVVRAAEVAREVAQVAFYGVLGVARPPAE